MELSNTFVVLMGLSIVFIGLICIVFLCKLMSLFCKRIPAESLPPVSTSSASDELSGPNRQELIAAISAVIGEELGTDVSGIKVCYIKKMAK